MPSTRHGGFRHAPGWSHCRCVRRPPTLAPDKAFANYVIDAWSIQAGLPQISALSLAQDRTGCLWVGTQSGLARFDGVRFLTFTPEDTPALPGIWIRALLSDRRDRLWIGTYKGLARYEAGSFRGIAIERPQPFDAYLDALAPRPG